MLQNYRVYIKNNSFHYYNYTGSPIKRFGTVTFLESCYCMIVMHQRIWGSLRSCSGKLVQRSLFILLPELSGSSRELCFDNFLNKVEFFSCISLQSIYQMHKISPISSLNIIMKDWNAMSWNHYGLLLLKTTKSSGFYMRQSCKAK